MNTNDTSEFAEKILLDAYSKMSPQKKLQQVVELTQATQKMALARIRSQYGPLSEQEEKLRLASLWLPKDTMIKYFNWNPEEKGY
jgi:hypothetical protein